MLWIVHKLKVNTSKKKKRKRQMTHVHTNFDDVPDEILPITPGTYGFVVQEAEIKENKKQTGMNLVVSMAILDEGEFKGRRVMAFMALKSMQTQIKRLCMACGVDVGADGLDTEDLVDKEGSFVLTTRTYQDNDGNPQEAANVKDYIVG